MLVNVQQISDLEQMSSLPRSRLYRLKPIGVGTSWVESLTGYVARLAEAYHVTPKEFIMQAILPAQGKAGTTQNHYSRLEAFWKRTSSSLNGITSIACEWVDTLQTMTSWDTLRYTTMLTWSEVIAVKGLLRSTKAWCPQCYEERFQTNNEVYEPLLWALNRIEVCVRHQQLLVSKCPHCQKTVPILVQGSRPGYCSQCSGWLGSTLSEGREQLTLRTSEGFMKQIWMAEALGGLLEVAPKLSTTPPKSQIATMMKHWIERYTNGNVISFSRLLGASGNLAYSYLHEGHIPTLDSLLDMSYALHTRPSEFLVAGPPPTAISPYLLLRQIPKVSFGRGKPVIREKVERLRQSLETILAQNFQPPLNPQLVAQSLGCSVDTIRKHCPAQYQAIMIQFRKSFPAGNSRERLRKRLEEVLRSDEIISLAAIAKELHCTCNTLRRYFPDLCQAVVSRFRNRIDHNRIRFHLRVVLTCKAPIPSVSELARQLGYNRVTIENAYPELCKQVVALHSAEQRHRYESRMSTTCEDVRQAMLALHQQNIYPSAKQVSELLGDPHVIREKRVLQTWHATLKELGYR